MAKSSLIGHMKKVSDFFAGRSYVDNAADPLSALNRNKSKGGTSKAEATRRANMEKSMKKRVTGIGWGP